MKKEIEELMATTLSRISKLLQEVDKNRLKIKIVDNSGYNYVKKSEAVTVYLTIDGTMFATGVLVQMPGCCGICISTGAYVCKDYRNKGIGLEMSKMRVELARLLGYSELICTDVTNNNPQQKILKRSGYKKLKTFVNKNTGNKIAIHALKLT